MKLIADLCDLEDCTQENVGGKAKSLALMLEAGLRVPEGIVITTTAFNRALKDNLTVKNLVKAALDYKGANSTFIRDKSSRINEEIKKIDISDVAKEAVNKLPGINEEVRYAVRSSATVEDSENLSYAGQFESYLDVEEQDVERRIKDVWASLYSDRAIKYSLSHKNTHKPSMAVIVQKMVDCKVSGVAFSVHPTKATDKFMYVEAVSGKAESLVSGLETPHSFVVDRADLRIVDKSDDASRTLSDSLVGEVGKQTLKIEKLTKRPVDVEWTCDSNGVLHILQSRPVTATAKRRIFDSSNIAESYSGITKPLTCSFARYVYSGAYKHFCRAMGVPNKTILKNEDMFRSMVVCINSHMYYDLLNWYKMISLFPGYQYSSEFMEVMMGVDEKYRNNSIEHKSFLSKILSTPITLWQSLRIFLVFLTLGPRISYFNRKFDKYYESVKRASEYEDGSVDELRSLYNKLDKDLISRWRVPIINDFAVMVSFGLAKNLYLSWTGSSDVYNFIQSNNKGELISLDPGNRLLEITNKIQNDSGIGELFRKVDSGAEILNTLREKYCSHSITISIEDYISEYGERAPNELKLESHTFTDKPELLIEFIKGHLSSSSKKRVKSKNLRSHYKTLLKKVGVIKYILLRTLFSWAGKSIRRREEARIRRGLAFGLIRRIFIGIGSRFFERGLISDKSDIFYLTTDDVFSIQSNEKIDFRAIIELRKKKEERDRLATPPKRIETTLTGEEKGSRFSVNDILKSNKNNNLKGVSGMVTSEGSNNGYIEGEALVLKEFDMHADFKDKILVTRQTDPGWTVVFPFLKGVIVERGGMLSHASIVAREFDISCITNARNATSIIENGDRISIDIKNGEVSRV